MHDHRCQRQSLLTALRAPFGHFVEAAKQPLEVIGYQLAVRAGQVVHAFVYRAERARSAPVVEVTAEALMSARRTGADEFGQFLLFVLESCRHRGSPGALGAIDDCWAPHTVDDQWRPVVRTTL